MKIPEIEMTRAEIEAVRAPVERASTMPARVYASADVYGVEVERLFRGQWLCAGRLDQVSSPGDYELVDLLGEPLIMTHAEDGRVRVLSRVCRHRGADLFPQTGGARRGNTTKLVCPYHAWVYRLDGSLIGAPLMQDAQGFVSSECPLLEVRSETWNGWVFINLSGDAQPLGPSLTSLSELLSSYGMEEMVAAEPMEFDSPWNWKVLVENFMEAYHHIRTHRDTLESMLPARESFVPDADGPYSVLRMPSKDPGLLESLSTLPVINGLEDWQRNTLIAAVVFPFHLFALTPDAMTWYQIFPDRHDHFTLRIYNCVPKSTAEVPEHADALGAVRELTRQIHSQDIGACDAVWAGLGSRLWGPGRLCLLEKSIWELNRWWFEHMPVRVT